MNWYLFGAYMAGLAFIVGLLLIFVWGTVKEKMNRDKKWFTFIENSFIPKMREAMISAVSEEMDIIPDKLKDIVKEINENDV